jgi:dihydroneopterin aldolase
LKAEAKIELRDLQLATSIGTYGPKDVVPDAHLLDLVLTIPPHWVQIAADEMAAVFDYDPLIARIDEIARAKKYETQEYLITLIAQACAQYPQVDALEICLRKQPVIGLTGSLGVRLALDTAALTALRNSRPDRNGFASS